MMVSSICQQVLASWVCWDSYDSIMALSCCSRESRSSACCCLTASAVSTEVEVLGCNCPCCSPVGLFTQPSARAPSHSHQLHPLLQHLQFSPCRLHIQSNHFPFCQNPAPIQNRPPYILH